MEKSIVDLINEYLDGKPGNGSIIWHKKGHRKGSGIFACVSGLNNGCSQVVNCPDCYFSKTGVYCLKDGTPTDGLLAVEVKHSKLINKGVKGAYFSIKDALMDLSD